MNASLPEFRRRKPIPPEFLHGYPFLAGGVEVCLVCPRLLDLLRDDLMEANGMHESNKLFKRIVEFRRERETDIGWAAFFKGVDCLAQENWQDALTSFQESRGIFLGRNDTWYADLANSFARDAELLKQMENKNNGAAENASPDPRQRLIDDELLWQWWRITHVPWN